MSRGGTTLAANDKNTGEEEPHLRLQKLLRSIGFGAYSKHIARQYMTVEIAESRYINISFRDRGLRCRDDAKM